MLSILGIGEVQFVLDHLHHLCANRPQACDHHSDHTTDHMLLHGLIALTELALEGEDTKREIVNIGGYLYIHY